MTASDLDGFDKPGAIVSEEDLEHVAGGLRPYGIELKCSDCDIPMESMLNPDPTERIKEMFLEYIDEIYRGERKCQRCGSRRIAVRYKYR